jgi:hypothetical protein
MLSYEEIVYDKHTSTHSDTHKLIHVHAYTLVHSKVTEYHYVD